MAEEDEIAALQREREMYQAQGKSDRAKEVAAALRARNVEVDDAPRSRRGKSQQTVDE